MMASSRFLAPLAVASLLAMSGCVTVKPYDYTNFRAHPPRSILVLPPVNESTAIEGTYGYLSTVSLPVAERGYYVFPVAVIDQFMKANGLPTAGDMQQAPLDKIRSVTGADAVMYLTLKQYGTKYEVITSVVRVEATAKLVDTRTGTLLWEGHGMAEQAPNNSSGNIIADLIATAIIQAINKKTDHAHQVSRLANAQMFFPASTGLPYGPYSPLFGKN